MANSCAGISQRRNLVPQSLSLSLHSQSHSIPNLIELLLASVNVTSLLPSPTHLDRCEHRDSLIFACTLSRATSWVCLVIEAPTFDDMIMKKVIESLTFDDMVVT
jgi:hypothetical protein